MSRRRRRPTPRRRSPAITRQDGDQDTVVGPIEFSVADRETAASQLTVSAAADGTSVFPADGVALGGSGAVRSITLTPLEATTGTANVTLTRDRSAGRGDHALASR